MTPTTKTPIQFATLPEWSATGIILGGLLAYLLMPEYGHYNPGALAAPAVALSIGLMVGPFVSGLLRPASLLRAEPVLFFGLIYWVLLDAIQGSYGLWGTAHHAVLQSFIGVAVFALGILAGSLFTSTLYGSERLGFWSDISPHVIFRAVLLTFFAGILKPLLSCELNPQCFVDSFFIPYKELPWRTVKFGAFDTVIKYVGFLGYLSLPLTAALYYSERSFTPRVLLSCILGLFLLLLFAQTGSRRFVGMVVMATGLTWVLLHERIHLAHLLKLALISALMLLLLETMVSWRNEGLGTAFISKETKTAHNQGLVSVDKNLYYMSHAMTVVPRLHDYAPVDGIMAVIAAPIPRSIWREKPTQGGNIPLLQLIGIRKGPGFSWSCSAVCDFYLMGGLVAIGLGGAVFGILAQLCNRVLYQQVSLPSRILYSFGLMSLFIGLRNTRDLTAIGLIVGIIWGSFYIRRLYIRHSRKSTGKLAE